MLCNIAATTLRRQFAGTRTVLIARRPNVALTLQMTTRTLSSSSVDDAPTSTDIANLQSMYKSDPSKAQVTFSSVSELTHGLRSTATIRDKYQYAADEPTWLGGTDSAPNPLEMLLASLGTCQEITYKAYAQVMGIKIERVSVSLDGNVDLRKFFGVEESARAGFSSITGTVTIKSDADKETLGQLKLAVDSHCPVLDCLSSIPVKITLVEE